MLRHRGLYRSSKDYYDSVEWMDQVGSDLLYKDTVYGQGWSIYIL